MELHAFLSNTRLKLAKKQNNNNNNNSNKKKQAKSKQHPWAELLLLENYSLPLSMLSSKNNRAYSMKMWKKPSMSVLMRLYVKKINSKKACIIQTVHIFYSSIIKHVHIF